MTGRHDLEATLAAIFADRLNRLVPDREADLFETGILDSLAFVDLLMHLEESFGIRIETDDFEIDRFRSISRIARFVESRQAKAVAHDRVGALVNV